MDVDDVFFGNIQTTRTNVAGGMFDSDGALQETFENCPVRGTVFRPRVPSRNE